MVQDDAVPDVEPAESHGPEVDGPDVVVDLLEADAFAAECKGTPKFTQLGDIQFYALDVNLSGRSHLLSWPLTPEHWQA